MQDYVVRAINANGTVRAFAANSKNLVQKAISRQHTFPVASAALGRTLTMGAILSSTCKTEKEVFTLRIEGDGPLGKMVVDASGRGGVRGMVDNPQIEVPHYPNGKLNVAGAVGEGLIHVIHDIGLAKSYHGSSPIISGELAEDFTYYFTASEQIPSSIGLGVLVQREKILASGGYMLQLLPEADEETISQLERQIARLNSITSLFEQGVTPEKLLQMLLGESVKFLSTHEIAFACTCSQKHVGQILYGLGHKELSALIEEQGEAEVICHFCNEIYHFNKNQLCEILLSIEEGSNDKFYD